MDKAEEKRLVEFVQELDKIIAKYSSEFSSASITGVLLSRVTHLMADDPETGKGLLRFVWEKLDEIEQSNPGQFL